METVTPKKRVGRQKIPDLMPAEIENERAPILMRSLPRILMLVKRCAIEARQRPFVPRKMGGNPIHNHANPSFVQRIDQKLKILRGAIPARRRIEAGDLVSP